MRPSEALAKHREEVRSIVSTYKVSEPRIFGSAARGEDTEESDLDIIVKRKDKLSYYDLFRLEDELAALLGVRVEVSTEGEFSLRIFDRIKRDFVPL